MLSQWWNRFLVCSASNEIRSPMLRQRWNSFRLMLCFCENWLLVDWAWKFLKYFFAETESLWSRRPVIQDFWKLYSIWPRYSTFKHFCVCSASDEIVSLYAQPAKKYVPVCSDSDEILSALCYAVAKIGYSLAEHARKSFRCTTHIFRVFPLFPHVTHFSVPLLPSLSRLCSLSPVLCTLSHMICSLSPILLSLSPNSYQLSHL